MRIAYVINSTEGGGAASPVPAVAKVLADQGATVEVFALTRRDGRAIPAMEAAGLRVHVRPGGEKDHLATLAWLDATLGAWRPDVIWTSLTRATLLGQLIGLRRAIPVVSWQHAAFLKPVNLLLLRTTQRLSKLWIGDSHSVTALTADRLQVPPDRLACWPLFAANEAAPQAEPWRPGEPVRIGLLGRLHPVKGHDVLIDALVRLRAQGCCALTPFEVLIAGEGAARDGLAASIASAGLDNVRLLGFAERPQAFLAGLHLYLQPSRSEGLCIAAHEAMQAGLPVIVSAVGELPYTVRDGETGLVVPPGDADALAHALAWMLSHPERLADMGAAGRRRVLDQFGAAAFAATGADIIGRLRVTRATGPAGAPGRSPGRRASGQSA